MNALVRKLEAFGVLGDRDLTWVQAMCARKTKVEANVDLIREGDKPRDVILVLEGLACRYKSTKHGGKQIFAYLVAGDFCDLNVALLDEMDHSIATLSDCVVARIPRHAITETIETRPALTRALWLCTLVDEAVLREWIVNVGGRDAEQRIAHLFCELHARLKAVGLTSGNSFALPITQSALGDTVGLSAVHANRSLRALREAGLVTFRDDVVTVSDMARLQAFAEFNPNYLHLSRKRQAS